MADTASPASTALAAVERGALAFGDFLRSVARRQVATEQVIDLPKPVVLTPEARQGIDLLPSVIDGAVTPTERRLLTQDEVASLMAERIIIDNVTKVLEGRKDAQRAAIFNHLDAELEQMGQADAERDAKGHFTVKGEVSVPETGRKFTRELRNGSPSLDAESLLALVDDPSVAWTHDDYLACTTQVRVVDEAKVLLHLRKRPEAVAAIAQATKLGSTTASLYVRKA